MIPSTRPVPPLDLRPLGEFRAAPDLRDWVKATFIDEDGPLYNPRHDHLADAEIGWLWTNYPAASKGRVIAGECRLVAPVQQRWSSAMAEWQLIGLFGWVPDFVVTLCASTAAWDDWSFCALVEHELCHAAQLTDEYGMPRFTRDGQPLYGIVGHDVEQFVDVVERYGASASMVEEMVRVANKGPTIGQAQITAACGTCTARKAA